MPNVTVNGRLLHVHATAAYHWTACAQCNAPICHLCAFSHGASGHGRAESLLSDVLGV